MVKLDYSLETNGVVFFAETLHLNLALSSDRIIRRPGFLWPPAGNPITVRAALYLQATGSSAATNPVTATKTYAVQANATPRYAAYRHGLLARHILDSGRFYSFVWLKQYSQEYGRQTINDLPVHDAVDLLGASRLLIQPNVRSSCAAPNAVLYVPWLKRQSLQGKDTAPDACTSDAYKNINEGVDQALIAGRENPLLRGGLAMTTLAYEFMCNAHVTKIQGGDVAAMDIKSANKDMVALDYCDLLFEYFLSCEYKDSGFFLRTRWPDDQSVHAGINNTYSSNFFASADEYTGFILGVCVYWLALDSAKADTRLIRNTHTIAARQNVVRQCIERIGTHLQTNGYLLLPPKGFPHQVRQKGWLGLFGYEHFINAALKKVCGRDFLADPITVTSPLFQRAVALPGDFGGDPDDKPVLYAMVGLEYGALDRALLSMKAVGIWRFYANKHVPLPGGDLLDARVPECDHFNFAMMLHAYHMAAIGVMDARERRKVDALFRTIARSYYEGKGLKVDVNVVDIIATLAASGSTLALFELLEVINTDGKLRKALGELYPGNRLATVAGAVASGAGRVATEVFGRILDVAATVAGAFGRIDKWDLRVGSSVPVPDCYVGALLMCFGYKDVAGDTDAHTEVIGPMMATRNRFAADLPLNGPYDLGRDVANSPLLSGCSDICQLILNHNSGDRIGAAFCWEGSPVDGNDWRMSGGLGELELESSEADKRDMILRRLQQKIDIAREGAGLDYLLPSVMMARFEKGGQVFLQEVVEGVRRGAPGPALRAKTSSPFAQVVGRGYAWNEPAPEADEPANNNPLVAPTLPRAAITSVLPSAIRSGHLPTDETARSGVSYGSLNYGTWLRGSVLREVWWQGVDIDYLTIASTPGYRQLLVGHVCKAASWVPQESVGGSIGVFMDGQVVPLAAVSSGSTEYTFNVLVEDGVAAHTVMIVPGQRRYQVQLDAYPIANAQGPVDVVRGQAVEITLTASHPDGEPYYFHLSVSGTAGTVASVDGPGKPRLRYRAPPTTTVTADRFEFTVQRGELLSNVASVTIKVVP